MRQKSGRNHQSGLSLLELLTVVAIIAILFALLLSAFGRSRTQAKATVDISNLHQLGLASSLYTEDQGAHPYSVAVLGHSDYGEPEIFQSSNDPSQVGLLNEFIAKVEKDMERFAPGDKTLWLKEPLPYKASYVGIGDIHVRFEQVGLDLQKRDNQGWAISLIEHQGIRPFPYMRPPYAYLRVHFDSSVKQYRSSYRKTPDGDAVVTGDLFGELKSGAE